MKRMRRSLPRLRYLSGLVCALALVWVSGAEAKIDAKGETKTAAKANAAADLSQQLGATLPWTLPVVDESGAVKELGALAASAPLLLVPVYYTCPNLCSLTLDYLSRSVAQLPPALAADLNIAVLSIDPLDTPGRAKARRAALDNHRLPGIVSANWHFLTASQATITAVLAKIGVPFIYDASSHEYRHPSVAVMLDGGGTIRQYVFGLDFPTSAIEAAYKLAANRANGSIVSRFLFTCFHFDPRYSRYGKEISFGLRSYAVLSLAGVGSLVFWLLRRRPRGKMTGQGQPNPGGRSL